MTIINKGTRGIDVNEVISQVQATAFFAQGYRFVLRYIRRITPALSDLSPQEVKTLLASGLGVMPVQHVKSEKSWIPSADIGTQYGLDAVASCRECGILPGVSVWLDLEGVDPTVAHEAIISYCNNWYIAVAQGGFLPGLYIGWHAGLNRTELYRFLKFQRYWSAYNLNADEYPITRGVCMKQYLVHNQVWDSDLVVADLEGALPVAHAPDEWSLN